MDKTFCEIATTYSIKSIPTVPGNHGGWQRQGCIFGLVKSQTIPACMGRRGGILTGTLIQEAFFSVQLKLP